MQSMWISLIMDLPGEKGDKEKMINIIKDIFKN